MAGGFYNTSWSWIKKSFKSCPSLLLDLGRNSVYKVSKVKIISDKALLISKTTSWNA
jgi:hypothetical protein